MNNMELCNAIQSYVHEHGKWGNDTNISVLERIMAHLGLSYDKGNMLFYNRDAELAALLQYLENKGTETDRVWILNQISEVSFSSTICELSPRFIETYRESDIAYKEGLYMICGSGFRKALEYLVYDYAVHCNPDKEEEIQHKKLYERIDTYLSSASDAQDLANAARKLGNNYTHIIQTDSDDYSLENLIAFVTLLASDISEILAPDDDIDYNVRMRAKRILGKL